MADIMKEYLKKYRFSLVGFYLLMLADTVGSVWLPVLLSDILNRGIQCTQENITTFIVVALAWIAAKNGKDYVASYLTNSISTEMCTKNVMKTTEIPLLKLYRMKRIEAVYAINNMSYFVPFYYLIEVPEVVLAVVKALVIAIVLLEKNTATAICIISLTILQFIVKQGLLKKIADTSMETNKRINRFQQDTHDRLVHLKDVLIHSLQEAIGNQILTKQKQVLLQIKKQVFWENCNAAESYLFGNGVNLLAIVIVCILLPKSGNHWGNYELYLNYTMLLLECIETLFEGMQFKKETEVQYKLFLNFKENEETSGSHFESQIEKITLQNVAFGYSDEESIGKNWNQVFEKGKIYVLKGENGSGKSTLINLLCGLLVPDKGRIILNHTDMEEWDKRRYLKEKVAIWDQQTELLFENLSENISFEEGNEEKGQKNYSGGEMQRIGFARMKQQIQTYESEILILDEPMNHLDTEGKKEVLRFLMENKNGKIVLIVSHENEIEQIADEIIWMPCLEK